MPVYDDEKQTFTPPSDDELRRITGMSEDEEEAAEREAYNATAADIAEREALGRSTTSSPAHSQESQQPSENSALNATGFAFNSQDKSDGLSLGSAFNAVKKHKKGLAIGGGVSGTIITLFVAAFFLLIPLKIEHIMNTLQKRFFGTTEKAVGDMSEVMLSHYIKKAVIPSLTKCSGTTLDKNCNPSITDTTGNPVTNVYKGWRNAKLEHTLAEKYGIEFKAVRSGSVTTYYMKTPGDSSRNGQDISAFVGRNDNNNLFQQVSRAGVREQVRSAFEAESKWKQMMYRFKVGRLLEQKYGLRRCIMFCGVRDQFADRADQKKNAAKLMLVQRVLIPLSTAKGIAVQCLITPGCDPHDTHPTDHQATNSAALNGAPENKETDQAVRTTIQELALHHGVTDSGALDKIIQDHKEMSEKGTGKYVVDKVMERIGLSVLSDKVANAVPVIGWISTGSQAITGLEKLGPAFTKLSYITASVGAVSMYSMYQSYADEVHTGHVDPEELGSMIDTFGPGDKGTITDPQKGGTAGAEGSPLYSALMSNELPSTNTALLDSILPQKAMAVSEEIKTLPTYTCEDDKGNATPLPHGALVCPEEKLIRDNAGLDAIHKFFNLPGINIIKNGANGVVGIIDIVLTPIGAVIGLIPGADNLTNLVSNVLEPVFSYLINTLFPGAFSLNMSGARTFNLTAAGAAAGGSTSGQNAIGGKVLTTEEVVAINNEQETEAKRHFASQPFMTRIFSTDSKYSLVSQVAMTVPIGHSNTLMQSSVSNLLSNPFSKIASSLGSVFSSTVNAQSGLSFDPYSVFGARGYGYTSKDIADIGDPEAYWEQHKCGDMSENGPTYKWNEQASKRENVDPYTGMPMNTTTNPCLLIKATTGSAGGYFSSDNLTSTDLGSSGGGL